MYKATSESAHFLPRTGSHSTKGSRSGRVDVLPPEAQIHELVYLDCLEQIQSLAEEQLAKEREAADLNAKLRTTMSLREFQDTERKKVAIGRRLLQIQSLMREAKELGHAASAESYALVFMRVARMRMTPESKRDLFRETEVILGHGYCQGVALTIGQKERSDQYRANLKARKKAQEHRRNNEKLIERMRDPDFTPAARSPFSRPTTDKSRVAELTKIKAMSRAISLDDQIQFVYRQLSNHEAMRDRVKKAGREVARDSDLWRGLLVNRAILDVLRALAACGPDTTNAALAGSPPSDTGKP